MAKTEMKSNTATEAPQQAPPTQLPATLQLRISHPKSAQDAFGISQSDWIVLTDVIFPNATSAASILLALRYCKARNLDIMKRVVNIVPMYSKALGKMVDTIWPGIAEVRITATRTGDYAGRDAEEFGPPVPFKFRAGKDQDGNPVFGSIEVPEWCRLTVYKIVRGQRCAFVGPTVYWDEAYATAGRDTEKPNEMWEGRRRGQVSKCAEAGSIRAAFPEETGGMLTSEEMHGRVIEGDINPETMVVQDDTIIPPRPKESDFAPKKEPAPKAVKIMAGGVDVTAQMPKTVAELEKQRPQEQARNGGAQQAAAVQASQDKEGEAKLPEFLDRRQQPAAEPAAVPAQPDPEPEDVAPTEAYMNAMAALDKVEETIAGMADLDVVKKEGRSNIDNEPGLTADEREGLRGRFINIVLAEQKRRAKKGRDR